MGLARWSKLALGQTCSGYHCGLLATLPLQFWQSCRFSLHWQCCNVTKISALGNVAEHAVDIRPRKHN